MSNLHPIWLEWYAKWWNRWKNRMIPQLKTIQSTKHVNWIFSRMKKKTQHICASLQQNFRTTIIPLLHGISWCVRFCIFWCWYWLNSCSLMKFNYFLVCYSLFTVCDFFVCVYAFFSITGCVNQTNASDAGN